MIGLLLTMALAADPCLRDSDERTKVSSELVKMWQADQADRAANSEKLEKNDAARVRDARKFADKGHLCSPQDKYYAALILYRSDDVDDLKIAYESAKVGMMNHVHSAGYVMAISFDKYQVARGLSQRYGTQIGRDKGKMCIYAVDATATNEERTQFEIPAIEEQYRKVLDANNFTDKPATAEEVNRRNLICRPVTK